MPTRDPSATPAGRPEFALCTSYYASPLLVESGFLAVRTSVGRPRWETPYQLANLPILAPRRSWLRLSEREYVPRYLHLLDGLGVEKIRAELTRIWEEHDRPEGLALLCFEKTGFCHRRLFSGWWREQTGEVIPELGADPDVITLEDQAIVWAALRAAGEVWKLDVGAQADEPLGPEEWKAKGGPRSGRPEKVGGTTVAPARRTSAGKEGVYYRDTVSGRRYEITYLDSEGKRRWQVIAGNLKDAVGKREELNTRVRKGEVVAHSEGRQTFATVASLFLDAQTNLRPKTIATYEAHLRNHVLPHLGRRRIDAIRVQDVADLVAALQKKGLAGWTIRGALTVTGRVFGFAVRRGWIAESPLGRLERGERPKVEKHEMRLLTTDEIGALLDAATTQRYRALLGTAIFSGLRQGELLGLTWQDLDLPGGLLHVRFQLDRTGKRVEPKTKGSRREVALFPGLVTMLRSHREAMLALGYAKPTDFVFSSETGGPTDHRNASRRGLAKAVERAGLTDPAKPNLRFHDLRHTYASILVGQGEDITYVAAQMGHSRPAVTLNTYSHLYDRVRRAETAKARMETQFGAILVETSGNQRWRTTARRSGRTYRPGHFPPRNRPLMATTGEPRARFTRRRSQVRDLHRPLAPESPAAAASGP
jgi:integrase